MAKLNILIILICFLVGCSSGSQKSEVKETVDSQKSESVDDGSDSDPMNNKGIGPVTNVELGAVDQGMVEEGKRIFEENCTACHKIDKKFIGPSPKGIVERRSPEWIMNMILNPVEMVQKDPIAKQLLMEANGAPMADQNLTEDQARNVLEYFRTLN